MRIRSPQMDVLAAALTGAYGVRPEGPDPDGWWTARGIQAGDLARTALAERVLVTGLRDLEVDLEAQFLHLTEQPA